MLVQCLTSTATSSNPGILNDSEAISTGYPAPSKLATIPRSCRETDALQAPNPASHHHHHHHHHYLGTVLLPPQCCSLPSIQFNLYLTYSYTSRSSCHVLTASRVVNACFRLRPCSHNTTTLTTIRDGKPRPLALETARGTTASPCATTARYTKECLGGDNAGANGQEKPRLHPAQRAGRWFGRMCGSSLPSTIHHSPSTTPQKQLQLHDYGVFTADISGT